MKLIVETTGEFMLMDPMSMNEVPPDRPAVFAPGAFVQQQMGLGQLRVLASDLPDEANDAEWAAWLHECEGNVPFAIESYKAKFAAEAQEESTSQDPPKVENPPAPPTEAQGDPQLGETGEETVSETRKRRRQSAE